MALTPRNSELWTACLASAQNKFPGVNPQQWRVQYRAVRRYLRQEGRFRLKANDPPVDRITLANALSIRGIEIKASLLTRSLDHQWRQYVGVSTISFQDFMPSSETIGAIGANRYMLHRDGYFGWRKAGDGLGIEVILPTAASQRIIVPSAEAYTLISLSRELSRREIRFRDVT